MNKKFEYMVYVGDDCPLDEFGINGWELVTVVRVEVVVNRIKDEKRGFINSYKEVDKYYWKREL